MPIDFSANAAPATTAVLTMEIQRGVVGDLSCIPALSDAVRQVGLVEHAADLVNEARRVGARVVHCVVEHRADLQGGSYNTPLMAALRSGPVQMIAGTPAAEQMPEIGRQPSDFVSTRVHGLSPFSGTGLDALLRNLGVRNVIAVGVSINVGVLGLCIEATNLGYNLIVATDAVVGVPVEYGQAVIDNTIRNLARLTTTDKIVEYWKGLRAV